MRSIKRWAAVAVVLLAATTLSGCQDWGCETGTRDNPYPMGLRLQGTSAVTVGTPSQLNVSVLYNDEIHVTDEARAKDAASLTWVVIPKDGAAISSSGVFTATKPGEYMVTVTLDNGNNNPVFAETRVTVSDAELTTTTTTEPTESSTESTSESTSTTAAATSGYAGTYKGTLPLSMTGGPEIQVPWEFTVDGEGHVEGGFQYQWGPNLVTKATFSGQVSADGRLDASGTSTNESTVAGQVHSISGPISLSGDISGDEFAGPFGGEGGFSEPVTATRQ
jgi:hypothetical protein